MSDRLRGDWLGGLGGVCGVELWRIWRGGADALSDGERGERRGWLRRPQPAASVPSHLLTVVFAHASAVAGANGHPHRGAKRRAVNCTHTGPHCQSNDVADYCSNSGALFSPKCGTVGSTESGVHTRPHTLFRVYPHVYSCMCLHVYPHIHPRSIQVPMQTSMHLSARIPNSTPHVLFPASRLHMDQQVSPHVDV